MEEGAATNAYKTRSRPTNEAQFNDAFTMAFPTTRPDKHGKELMA
jgi:hypothetical protein